MSVLKSKYDAELCCEHDWGQSDHSDLGVVSDVWTCWQCGAWCRRDANNQIVSYAAYGVESEAAE